MANYFIETQCSRRLADVITPVGIYLRVRDRFRDTILLESADFHSAENSWSFIGINAIAGFEAIDLQTVEFKYPGQKPERLRLNKPTDLPAAFKKYTSSISTGGDTTIKEAASFFGYTSFDAVQFFEQIKFNDAKESPTARHLLRYRLYQYVVAIHHFKDERYICENKVKGLATELPLVDGSN